MPYYERPDLLEDPNAYATCEEEMVFDPMDDVEDDDFNADFDEDDYDDGEGSIFFNGSELEELEDFGVTINRHSVHRLNSARFSEFADPGGRSALRAASRYNPRNLPCPTCGEPNRLTPKDRALGYQCDSCADRAEWGGY